MRNPEKTIGNLINHQDSVFVSFERVGEVPKVQTFCGPFQREGIKIFYFPQSGREALSCKACLYFCDRRFFRGVLLLGTAEPIQSPEGPALRFTAQKGRYSGGLKSEDFIIA